jgi:hypothetical protein
MDYIGFGKFLVNRPCPPTGKVKLVILYFAFREIQLRECKLPQPLYRLIISLSLILVPHHSYGRIQSNVFTAEMNAYGRSDYSGDLETQRICSHFTVQKDDNFPNFLLFDTPFIINSS